MKISLMLFKKCLDAKPGPLFQWPYTDTKVGGWEAGYAFFEHFMKKIPNCGLSLGICKGVRTDLRRFWDCVAECQA